MPVDGLSLVGFMEDEHEAIAYLFERCVWEDASNASLRSAWTQARTRRGRPAPLAGRPNVSRIPDALSAYVDRVRTSEGYLELADGFGDPEPAMVELGPLLAYQHHIELDRASTHVAHTDAGSLPLERLLEICLPLTGDPYVPQVSTTDHGVVFRSDSLNFRIVRSGLFDNAGDHYRIAGAFVGTTGPLLHVARYHDRLYLRNGFHRAVALQRAGIGEVPCLIVEARTIEDTGAQGGRQTFGRELLTSDDPPTLSHFTAERAFRVRLRRLSRVITVTWTDTVFEEP